MKNTKRKRGAAPVSKAKAGPDPVSAAPGAADSCAIAPPAGQAAQDAAGLIVLASYCGVKDAAALKQSLCQALAHEAPVRLDVRSVERVDTATMQLLCAFVRDRSAQQRAVEWLGDASAIREAARLLGVTRLLALPQPADAAGVPA